MARRLPRTSTDVHPTHTEVELVEETVLVQVGISQLALRLEQVAQERDPLAEALQQELARESREAYLKDWKTFARWLEATAGHPQTSVDLSSPAGVLQAMGAWLQLGDQTARALVQKWMADQTRQGLAAATSSSRASWLPPSGMHNAQPPRRDSSVIAAQLVPEANHRQGVLSLLMVRFTLQ